MIVIEGRFGVKLISADALAQYMRHRDFTVRTLADEVTRIRKCRVSPATIGHLRSGKRNTCHPDTAKAIEKALGAPRGSLFVADVSHVAREVRAS